jgi:hypothetical protein
LHQIRKTDAEPKEPAYYSIKPVSIGNKLLILRLPPVYPDYGYCKGVDVNDPDAHKSNKNKHNYQSYSYKQFAKDRIDAGVSVVANKR